MVTFLSLRIPLLLRSTNQEATAGFATDPTCCISPKKSALHPHLHRLAVTDTPDDLRAKRHRLAGRGGTLKVASVFRADVHAADDLVAISDEVLDVMSGSVT